MPTRLTGKPSLAYTGVEAPQPPNIVALDRAPTTNDYLSFNTGDLWLNTVSLTAAPPVAPTNADIWMLVSKNKRIANATWVNFGNAPGTVIGLRGDDGVIVSPAAGIIDVHGQPNAGATIRFTGLTPTLSLNTTDALDNIFIGRNSGNATLTGNTNVSLGVNTGKVLTTGSSNTLIGTNPGALLTTGSSNSIVGASSGALLTTATNNSIFGYNSGYMTTGSRNLLLGAGAGTVYVSTESDNILLGYTIGTVGDNNTIRIGVDGNGAGQQNQTFIAGTVTTARGLTVLTGNATITAGNLLMTETNNAGTSGIIFLGAERFVAGKGSSNTVYLGGNAGNLTTTGTNNTFVGDDSGSAVTTGSFNTGLGQSALTAVTTGGNNTAIGQGSLQRTTTGIDNTAIGLVSGQFVTTGSRNTLLGDHAGMAVGTGLVTGSNNIIIGTDSGNNYTAAESSNIIVSSPGVVGENNIIRLGTSGAGAGQQNKCFIAGIRGVTTDVNDAVPVLIDSAGQLGVTSSSARYKKNINDMGSRSDDIMKLRPKTFNFVNDSSGYEQFGLIAEEVHEVFPRLVVYDNLNRPETIKYHDLVPLMLNEIQKLNKRIEELERKIV